MVELPELPAETVTLVADKVKLFCAVTVTVSEPLDDA